MWIERDISTKIRELIEVFPALILTGARQTGKTSLLRKLFPEYNYVSLDLGSLAQQAEESPESFLRDYSPPLIVDEVQYAPKLFRHIKVAIDSNREARGQFLLTGSQKFTLMKEVSDSLAGRCVLMSLPGLSISEIESSGWDGLNQQTIGELIVRGSFPELWANILIPEERFYQSYISTYLERDLRQVLRVGSLRDFERFMRACAVRSGNLLNKSDLARDVGISATTANEWISALEASNQISLLEPFFANVGKRLVKSPKLYFNDTGLLCFLLGLNRTAIGSSTLTGAIWENLVFLELKKWLDLKHPNWTLWFYRDQQNREVDFLVQGPYEKISLIDAKWSENPKETAFNRLEEVSALLEKNPSISQTNCSIICRTPWITGLGNKRTLCSVLKIREFLEQN